MDATVATSPPPRFHENSPSILLTRGLSVSENVPLSQSPPSTSSPSTSISDKSAVTQSVHSPKDSPAKHNKSRVVQTYIAYKDNQRERKHNAKMARQPPKDGTEQNQPPQKGPHPLMMIQDDIDPKRRVLVSGFPPYTQPQDLIRVLSPFGACTVDKCRNRLAVVTFGSEECAKSAMKASEDICIYGDFIEIKPFTNPRHVEDMFKAYKKVIATQKGQDIIPPDQIDLSGDFYQQVANIQKAIKLTEEQLQAINKLYADLEMVLQQEWPGCVAVPFGSIPVGLGIKSSDADCFVRLAEEQRARGGGAGFVARARRVLQRYPHVFTHLVAIPRANTPILKFRHVPSGFHCDVNAKTPLGAQNSLLMKTLLEADERLPPLALLVKYWARVHRLSGTGRLTNYALLLFLFLFDAGVMRPALTSRLGCIVHSPLQLPQPAQLLKVSEHDIGALA